MHLVHPHSLHRKRAATAAAALVCGALLAGCGQPQPVELTLFVPVEAPAPLAGHAGMTHGAAWGDFDGDGRPDVYLTNHLAQAMLLRNEGGWRFADVTAQWLAPADLGGDKHGAAWADFDNDGRPDLVQLTGAKRGIGAEGKRLFRNDGSRLTDVAEPMGVFNPQARTRMPLWLDLDNDGRLDLLHGAEARFDNRTPPLAFRQGAADVMCLHSQIFDGAQRAYAFEKCRCFLPTEAGFAAAVHQRLVQDLDADPGSLPQDDLGAIGLRAVVEQVKNDIRVRELSAHARHRGSGVPQRAACPGSGADPSAPHPRAPDDGL